MNPRQRLYLAAPLFSTAERQFNLDLRAVLNQYFEVYLPQVDGALVCDLVASGMAPAVAMRYVFDCDLQAIHRSDCLLIVLDGSGVDEGAAFELGVAYQQGKQCYGLQTDPRRLLPIGNNPMIECSVQHVFKSVCELARWVELKSSEAVGSKG